MEVDTFFYLTTDDQGSTSGDAAIVDDAAAVAAAILSFRPQRFYHGPFTNATPPTPACSLSPLMRRPYKYDDPKITTWHVWWATWEKVRRCFNFVVEHERAFGLRYEWVVRMRADVWFFGEMPPLCSFDAASGIVLPAGVVGCCFPRSLSLIHI